MSQEFKARSSKPTPDQSKFTVYKRLKKNNKKEAKEKKKSKNESERRINAPAYFCAHSTNTGKRLIKVNEYDYQGF